MVNGFAKESAMGPVEQDEQVEPVEVPRRVALYEGEKIQQEIARAEAAAVGFASWLP